MRPRRRKHGYGHQTYVEQPKRCPCESREDAPSTHRGALHLSTCIHSELDATTERITPPTRKIRKLELL